MTTTLDTPSEAEAGGWSTVELRSSQASEHKISTTSNITFLDSCLGLWDQLWRSRARIIQVLSSAGFFARARRYAAAAVSGILHMEKKIRS